MAAALGRSLPGASKRDVGAPPRVFFIALALFAYVVQGVPLDGRDNSPPSVEAVQSGDGVVVGTEKTVPLISATSAGFASVPTPTCPGGTDIAPQRLMWNVMYEPYKDGTPRGNDLSGLDGTTAGELLCVCE